MKPKHLEEQVIVITGGSSGIGLATAKKAARHGARVVLAARDEDSLRRAVDEIKAGGGQAAYAVADVANMDEVRRIAETAIREFGGFDTWVNDAGVTIYGEIEQVPVDDARRLFETNYFGVVNGSLVAVEHFRRKKGVLINVGSVLSDRAIPLQGHYSASKHAVKGFTDALRMELEKDDAPIWVTLVKPSSIATPYAEHARNYMDTEPNLPPPVYAPEEVAHTILEMAEHPRRDITVGAGGRMFGVMESLAPRMTDHYMEATLFEQQQWDRDNGGYMQPDALYGPIYGSGREHGEFPHHVFKRSLYTRARMNPGTTMLLALGAIGLGVYLGNRRRSDDRYDFDEPDYWEGSDYYDRVAVYPGEDRFYAADTQAVAPPEMAEEVW